MFTQLHEEEITMKFIIGLLVALVFMFLFISYQDYVRSEQVRVDEITEASRQAYTEGYAEGRKNANCLMGLHADGQTDKQEAWGRK